VNRFRAKYRFENLTIRLSICELVPTDAKGRKYLLLLTGQERSYLPRFSFLKFRTTGINAFPQESRLSRSSSSAGGGNAKHHLCAAVQFDILLGAKQDAG
jgi:hypothetical protein